MDDASTFAELFPAVYHAFCRRLGPHEHRPSPESAAVLEHLFLAGPLTISEAARHFGRSQAATSELVGRMEARGFVTRIRDDRDHRRHLVWLTASGRDAARTQRRVLDELELAAAFRAMTATKRKGLIVGMRALLAASRRTTEEDSCQ